MATRFFPLLLAVLVASSHGPVLAFAPNSAFLCRHHQESSHHRRHPSPLAPSFASHTGGEASIERVSEEDEAVPIPFLDHAGSSFIECHVDSIAKVAGVEYTIGTPCDTCVALCYMEGDEWVNVEVDDKMMDDLFPVAENIVNEEFGEELALQRTPETLTLVGEMEEDDDDDDDDEMDDDDEEEDDDDSDDGTRVEVLLSFDHRDIEYNLVRMIDPVILVGKAHPERPDLRVLLNPEESEKLMPVLESLFLQYEEENNSMLP